jgi:hypothetical protein
MVREVVERGVEQARTLEQVLGADQGVQKMTNKNVARKNGRMPIDSANNGSHKIIHHEV